MAKPRRLASLRVPDESVPALNALIQLGPDFIKRLTEALAATGPSLDDPSFRAVAISERLGDPQLVEDIETTLVHVIDPMIYALYSYDIKIDDFLDALDQQFNPGSSAADTDPSIMGSDRQGDWSACRGAFRELLDSEPLILEAKARILLEARANLVEGLKIYSDLRPVFDQGGGAVRAHVLTNSLRIRFRGGQGAR